MGGRVMSLLLHSSSVDANCLNVGGWSPLAICVDRGHVSCTRFLLSVPTIRVTDPLPDAATPTLLHLAAHKGHTEILAMLLQHKDSHSELEATNEAGFTPFLNAIATKHADCLA